MRRLVVAVLVLAASIAATAAPTSAGAPSGSSSGGCGKIVYKRTDGTLATSALCSAPAGSEFHSGGRGTASDPGCTFPKIKIFEDGLPHPDPTLPDGHYITEPALGDWRYVDKSDLHDFPIDAHPPAGMDFDAWMNSFPTYQDNAGGSRVFDVVCVGPDATYWGFYPDVTVAITDPFWGDLPGQLAALAARVHLATPTLAFEPGGPDVWGGFLTNAPYAVSLGNDGIWHSVRDQDIDPLGAWQLTVIASPVSATVIVQRGNGTPTEMDCAIGASGPIAPSGLPRFDPPAAPVNLPACAFTARWAQASSMSVSMRINYRVAGFIGNLAQALPDQPTTSAVQTWPVVRAEAVNTDGN